MGDLRDNPVFERESRGWLRGRWLRHSRSAAWTAAVIAALFVWFYARGLWAVFHGDEAEFRPVWFWLIRFLLVLIVLLGPVLTSAAVTKEREQRTWESLTLTRLSGREIFVGKWLASLTPLFVLILATAPLLMVAYATFGTSFEGLLAVLFFYPATAAAYTLLGLLCSFLGRKASVARTSALAAAFGLCFGLLVVDTVFRGLVAPQSRGYSAMNTLSSAPNTYHYYQTGVGGTDDYGYFGAPAVSWLSPFFVLSVVSDWTVARAVPSRAIYTYGAFGTEDRDDVWSTHPSSVLLVYSLSLALGGSFCLYYVLTRYRRDVRGGRPLGESIT